MDTLFEFAKMIIPAAIVLYAAYLFVQTLTTKDIDMKKLEIRESTIKTILPTRLQAYERMVLFLERIAPQNLLLRLNDPTHTADQLHKLLIREIQNEYNHNTAQQLYMSEQVWELIKNSKENLIELISEVASTLSKEATGTELSREIFKTLIAKKINPTALAMSELKKEIQQIF